MKTDREAVERLLEIALYNVVAGNLEQIEAEEETKRVFEALRDEGHAVSELVELIDESHGLIVRDGLPDQYLPNALITLGSLVFANRISVQQVEDNILPAVETIQ